MPRHAAEPKTLSDAAFLRLRADIMRGDLRPGTKLKIGDLVARYDVGASPLREALARLSSDHLVVLEGQRGFTVAPISKSDVLDLARVRQLVEGEAVAQSVERGDVDWEARIVAAYFRLQRAHRQSEAKSFAWSQAWEDRNREFHDALCSACGSVWLLRLQQQLYEQSERYRHITFDKPRVPRDGDAEHKAMMDACLARNVGTARRLAAQHIQRTATIVSELIPDDAIAKPTSRIVRLMSGGTEPPVQTLGSHRRSATRKTSPVARRRERAV